jgi:manganese-dependent inorganic pyrophosphatase
VDAPDYLPDVKVRVEDLSLYTPTCLSADEPVNKVWDALKKSTGCRIVPVVNSDECIEGIVSIGDITKLFLEISDESVASRYEILFKNLLEILGGRLVAGSYNYEKVSGSVYIGTNIPDDVKVTDKDVILTAKLENALKFAHVHNCGCVILTDGIKPLGFESVKTAVVSVDYTMFKTVSMISSAISIRSIMNLDGIISFANDSYIDDIIDVMKTSKHRNFPVVDRKGHIKGVISRRHLIDYKAKNVVLIDHNEKSQSVDGLEQARITEVIDHHRVADIQTESPLYIRSEPVGCSATIIFKMYSEHKAEIQPQTAGLLLGAILSDTLMFSSPTCTQDDVNAANRLAEIAAVNIEAFGREMFTVSTALDDYSVDEILSIDRKQFMFDKYCAFISQVNTLDFKSILDKENDIADAMAAFGKENNADLVLLMVTDIVAGGSEVIAVGKAKDLMYRAFGMERGARNIFLPGVVSRKKQVVPQLTHAVNALD